MKLLTVDTVSEARKKLRELLSAAGITEEGSK